MVDPADIHLAAWFDAEFPALLCEFKTDIATYLQTHTAAGYPKTLADLIAFNEAHTDLEGPNADAGIPWNNDLWEIAESTNGRDAECAAQRAIATPGAREAIDAALAENDLDAIIALTNSPATLTDPVNGDDLSLLVGPPVLRPSPATRMSPSLRVTSAACRLASFMGTRWSEPQLLGFAFDFEQATHVRVPPQFLASTSGLATATAKHGASGAAARDRARRVHLH